ncbi:MAG: exodeoxyribonuclease VII large subunit, partial [Clostridia bacterium]|nr:exodeoxyribonuclease VII large subunit [Clostridia bacterium]
MNEAALWSVTGLNEYVSAMLASDLRLRGLRVRGEIGGLKRHSSGHMYFTLKDDHALVRCVMFRQQAQKLGFAPRDGMLVILTGAASLYTRDGAFQLYAQALEPCGDGALYQRFLELKD